MRLAHNADRRDGTEQRKRPTTCKDPSVEAALLLAGSLLRSLLLRARPRSNLRSGHALLFSRRGRIGGGCSRLRRATIRIPPRRTSSRTWRSRPRRVRGRRRHPSMTKSRPERRKPGHLSPRRLVLLVRQQERRAVPPSRQIHRDHCLREQRESPPPACLASRQRSQDRRVQDYQRSWSMPEHRRRCQRHAPWLRHTFR